MISGRRFRTMELLLLVVLLVAVGWVLQLRRGHTTPSGPVAVGPGPDFGPPVRVAFPAGRDSIVVTGRGDEYAVNHPVRDRAAPLFLAEMVRMVRKLESERVLDGESGRRYGLEGPGPTLRLTDAAGHIWTLRLGDEAPTGSLVYARVGAPPAPPFLLDRFTVRKYFYPELRTVRDPVPTALRPGPIDSVAVLVPGRELHAARISRELWRMRVPAGLEADPLVLNGVVRQLRDPSIIDYPPPSAPLRTLGLDPPRAAWVLCQGSRQDTVWVGHGAPDQQGVYILPAHREGPAVLSSEHFRSLVDGWPGLVDRRLLRLAMDSVTVVEFPGCSLSFHREQGTWRRYPGGSEMPRASALKQDLVNLAALRWTRYPLPEELPPRGAERLVVRLATPSKAETLALAAPVDTLGWARATHASRWGRVPAATWIAWSYHATRRD